MSSLVYSFAFDVMGDLAFGESFGMLEGAETPPEIALLRSGMKLTGRVTPIPWVFLLLESIPGILPQYKRMVILAAQRLQRRLKVRFTHVQYHWSKTKPC